MNRLLLLLPVLLLPLAMGANCGDGTDPEASPTPRPELAIERTIPEDGETALSVGQPINVFFTRPVGWVRFCDG